MYRVAPKECPPPLESDCKQKLQLYFQIYEGQLLALNTFVKDDELKKTIEEMKEHEREHANYFEQEITKKSFFKRIIPDSIYKRGHKLTVAKDIYHFIQNHFTWNGNFAGDMRKNIRRNFIAKKLPSE